MTDDQQLRYWLSDYAFISIQLQMCFQKKKTSPWEEVHKQKKYTKSIISFFFPALYSVTDLTAMQIQKASKTTTIFATTQTQMLYG